MKNKHGLTKHQQGFCDDLRSSPELSATQAYLNNYSVKSENAAAVSASKLLRNAKVKSYLNTKQEVAELKADYEQAQWVEDMLKLKRMCMAEEDVTVVIEKIVDDQVKRFMLTQREFNPAGANKALETLARFKRWLSDSPSGGPAVTVNTQQAITFVAAKMDD